MDAEGCLPPPHPHKALIFPFEFNEVTFCPVSSCKKTYLCLSPEPLEGRKVENACERLWRSSRNGTHPSHK